MAFSVQRDYPPTTRLPVGDDLGETLIIQVANAPTPLFVRLPVLPPRSVAQYTYLLNTFGFFAVGLLSGAAHAGVWRMKLP
jgi:hypothetical protein